MVGTLINTGAIIAGGVCGHLFGKLLKDRPQETLTMACGVSTLFIGIAGTMKYMLHNDLFPDGGAMLAMVACGEYPDVKTIADKFVRVTGTEKPDPELAALYEDRYQRFREIYPSVKDLFPKLIG